MSAESRQEFLMRHVRATWRTAATSPARVFAAAAAFAVAGPDCPGQPCLWEHLQPLGPGSGATPVAVWDSARQRIVVVESRESDWRLRTWEWDGVAWMLRAEGGPSNRYFHGIAYDEGRARLVLFGGYGGVGSFLADTWEWNGATWSLASASGPPGRFNHAMAYDTARSRVIMLGGDGPTNSDTWAWDGATWTRVAESGPSPRQGAAMAYDAARQRIVLFGGFVLNFPALGDLWEWDGAAWTQRSTVNAPGPRSDATMVFDSVRSRLVMYGGANGTSGPAWAETWEFDGLAGSWQLRTGGGPPAGAGRPFAFDSARGVGILLDQLGGTWQWSGSAAFGPPWITQHPASTQASPGASVSLTTAALGDPPLQYAWRRSGVVLSNGGTISGATTPTLTIFPASISDSGYYTVDALNACGTASSFAAHVQIGPPACYANCDGGTIPPILNINDFICFMNRYAAADPYANCDGSTHFPYHNVNDFSCFLNRYAAGCP